MAIITAGTWPQSKKERITAPVGSDLRQGLIQLNLLMTNLSTYYGTIATGNYVINPVTASRGTTVTYSLTAGQVGIGGVPVAGFGALANQAFGALGTVPADTWALVAFDQVGAGTVTLVSAAANYTTGYATEAAAIAAIPAVTAANARTAYLTLKTKAATVFIFATDSLAGGATGNVASATNYYSMTSVYDNASWTAFQIANQSGTLLSAANY